MDANIIELVNDEGEVFLYHTREQPFNDRGLINRYVPDCSDTILLYIKYLPQKYIMQLGVIPYDIPEQDYYVINGFPLLNFNIENIRLDEFYEHIYNLDIEQCKKRKR